MMNRTYILAPTRATSLAIGLIALIIVGSAAYLGARYASLPIVLPVHFKSNGFPNGWQYKTPARVLVPVFVQIALTLTLGAIGALLLFRRSTDLDGSGVEAADARAAGVAAEAVVLITLIWVAFQGYAAWALVQMWTAERAGLGPWYYYLEVAGGIVTLGASIRAHRRLGRPAPRPFVAEHWRLGQLYNNRADPSLFVPTRDGRRWTLNFGRPVAAMLLGLILLLGVAGPTVILVLMLRG